MTPNETTGRGKGPLIKQLLIFVVVFAVAFLVTRYLLNH